MCATHKETLETVIFRSYALAPSGVKIWEAAYAASATSSIFDPSPNSDFEEQFFCERNNATNHIQEVWNEAQTFVSSNSLIDNITP